MGLGLQCRGVLSSRSVCWGVMGHMGCMCVRYMRDQVVLLAVMSLIVMLSGFFLRKLPPFGDNAETSFFWASNTWIESVPLYMGWPDVN